MCLASPFFCCDSSCAFSPPRFRLLFSSLGCVFFLCVVFGDAFSGGVVRSPIPGFTPYCPARPICLICINFHYLPSWHASHGYVFCYIADISWLSGYVVSRKFNRFLDWACVLIVFRKRGPIAPLCCLYRSIICSVGSVKVFSHSPILSPSSCIGVVRFCFPGELFFLIPASMSVLAVVLLFVAVLVVFFLFATPLCFFRIYCLASVLCVAFFYSCVFVGVLFVILFWPYMVRSRCVFFSDIALRRVGTCRKSTPGA